jgi:hypothetical protein
MSNNGPIKFEIKGMDDLKRKLAAMADEGKLGPVLRDALSAGGGEIKKQMESDSPVETGWLESHFRVTKPFIKLRQNIAAVWIGPSKRKYTRPSEFLKSGKKRKGIGGKALKKGESDDNAKSPAMIAGQIQLGTNHKHQNAFMTRAVQAAKSRALERMIEKLKSLVAAWAR